MSHHLDTPLAAKTGQLLIDDLYVFPGEGGTVFILDVNSDVNGLHTEPGFHPEARYEIKIHRGRAAFEELTYRFAFAEPDGDGRQRLTLHKLTGDEARGDDGVGGLQNALQDQRQASRNSADADDREFVDRKRTDDALGCHRPPTHAGERERIAGGGA